MSSSFRASMGCRYILCPIAKQDRRAFRRSACMVAGSCKALPKPQGPMVVTKSKMRSSKS